MSQIHSAPASFIGAITALVYLGHNSVIARLATRESIAVPIVVVSISLMATAVFGATTGQELPSSW